MYWKKRISDTAMSLEEHQKEIESLRMQAEDMEMKYKNKITTMQKELREAKDREVESKEKTTDLESQIQNCGGQTQRGGEKSCKRKRCFSKGIRETKKKDYFSQKEGRKRKAKIF